MPTIRPVYDKQPLDFSPEVANQILERLSFGFDEEFVWNVPGAPTVAQMVCYVRSLGSRPGVFCEKQWANLDLWIRQHESL